MKLNNLIILSSIFVSCSSATHVVGNYDSAYRGIKKSITINDNHTFSFLLTSDVCPLTVYGGQWEKKNNYLFLSYLWPKIPYFKKDTILVGKTEETTENNLTVIYNGLSPADSVQIKINDLSDSFYTDKNGDFHLHKNIQIRNIKIRKNKFLNQWTEFIIRGDYNNFLMILYDDISEPCGFYYLPSKVNIKRNGLWEDSRRELYKRY